ncbi:MAG: Jag protein [Microgenomates group bacterium GW2011_GWF2_45_18]|nr:MAG: Jag protein [Microgenomates group bacterium GW2011_GWF1_44_10]KKU01872.1 MAG: Jag protein [Microgenomates group bacterium GW2011_GWF2_45_18]OGJ41117.1 MAG: hypothetical protein A2378_04525 [Candidatus Pacebacteria bacterium RIFOXYB1_FULL_44_10]
MIESSFLEKLLGFLGIEEFTIEQEDVEDGVIVHIMVPEEGSGVLIGRRGETLQALQAIVRLGMREQLGDTRVTIDINHYKEGRLATAEDVAKQAVDEVLETGKPVTLPYLSSEERRYVHMLMSENEGVQTQSSGEGRFRRLTVFPAGYFEESGQSPTEEKPIEVADRSEVAE